MKLLCLLVNLNLWLLTGGQIWHVSMFCLHSLVFCKFFVFCIIIILVVNTLKVGQFLKIASGLSWKFCPATPGPYPSITTSTILGVSCQVPQGHVTQFVHFPPFLASVDVKVCNPRFKFPPYSLGSMVQWWSCKEHILQLSELFLLLFLAPGEWVCWAYELWACLPGSFMNAEGGRRVKSSKACRVLERSPSLQLHYRCAEGVWEVLCEHLHALGEMRPKEKKTTMRYSSVSFFSPLLTFIV